MSTPIDLSEHKKLLESVGLNLDTPPTGIGSIADEWAKAVEEQASAQRNLTGDPVRDDYVHYVILAHKRFVQKVDLEWVSGADKDGSYAHSWENRQEMAMFDYKEGGDFNIVTSLCTDGYHRPIFDLDMPNLDRPPGSSDTGFRTREGCIDFHYQGGRTVLRPGGNIRIVKSTNNYHAYSSQAMTFSEYCDYLTQVPGKAAANYLEAVKMKGYGCARPPWIKKEKK